MIEVEETEAGLRAVDVGKNELEVEIDDWVPGGSVRSIGRRVDETMAGSAKQVFLPASGVVIQSRGRDRWRPVLCDEDFQLDDGEHLVQVDAAITAFVSVEGPVTVRSNSAGEVGLSFPERAPLNVAFRSSIDCPTDALAIRPTLDGFAAALTHMGTTPATETPDRSYPSMRGHPPLVEIDANADHDRYVDRDASIRIRVPRSFEALFALAPLAYYLGGEVTVEPRESPTISTNDARYDFDSESSFHEDVAGLLRRVFYLDCLVRNAGPYGFDVVEMTLLEGTPLDPESVYDLPMSDRLRVYLDFPFEDIESELPSWPLVTHMDADPSNIALIPHLLDRFSLIFPATAEPLDHCELVDRSLADFCRSSVPGGPSDTGEPVDLLSPDAQFGKSRGWLSEGAPVDAFKLTHSAFENRLSAFERSGEPLNVTVILNESSMEAEHSDVERIYERRSKELSLDLGIEECTSRGELREILTSDRDFVHYIGHCDPAGLRCHDGHLATSDLTESGIQAFFLNACGSYRQGLELVHKGAITGAVTIGDVIDEQARKVGAAFARLLMWGFSVERALAIARTQAILSQQYTVVGDGTHVLAQCPNYRAPLLQVSLESDGDFSIHLDGFTPRFNGGVSNIFSDRRISLSGSSYTRVMSAPRFEKFLKGADDPIFYDEEIYWPEELLNELF